MWKWDKSIDQIRQVDWHITKWDENFINLQRLILKVIRGEQLLTRSKSKGHSRKVVSVCDYTPTSMVISVVLDDQHHIRRDRILNYSGIILDFSKR